VRTVAVIMAGGKGERFWPRSTASMPKRFLYLWGKVREASQKQRDEDLSRRERAGVLW